MVPWGVPMLPRRPDGVVAMHCSCPREPKAILAMVLRVSFGLSILFIGIAHYRTLPLFVTMVSDGLGSLSALGTLWAYILPALLIVGGGLLAINMYHEIAVWCGAIALGSIPAGVFLKPLLSEFALLDAMPAAMNAFIWILVFVAVVKLNDGRS